MPKKKQAVPATARFDISLKDSDFIQSVPRPNFDMTRDDRLRDGYRRGVPMVNLLQNSGYTPRQLFAVLKLDEARDFRTYEELCHAYDKLRGTQDGRPKNV